MINSTLSLLLDKVDSKYSLVVAVSKRARQLVDGKDSYVDSNSSNPVSIAIQEISEEKIVCINNMKDDQIGE